MRSATMQRAVRACDFAPVHTGAQIVRIIECAGNTAAPFYPHSGYQGGRRARRFSVSSSASTTGIDGDVGIEIGVQLQDRYIKRGRGEWSGFAYDQPSKAPAGQTANSAADPQPRLECSHISLLRFSTGYSSNSPSVTWAHPTTSSLYSAPARTSIASSNSMIVLSSTRISFDTSSTIVR